MSRSGNGRRLTYRERWARLQEWVNTPSNWDCSHWYVQGILVSELCKVLDKLNHTTLIKARPVRKRKGRKR